MWFCAIMLFICYAKSVAVYRNVSMKFSIKDPIGLETSFLYHGGWIEVECSCDNSKLYVSRKKFTIRLSGNVKFVLNKKFYCLYQDAETYHDMFAKEISVKYLLCNPYTTQVNNCSDGTFCMIGKDNKPTCGTIDRDMCFLPTPVEMYGPYFKPLLYENKDFYYACANLGTRESGFGLCSSYDVETGRFVDYQTQMGCSLHQVVTLSFDNCSVLQLGTGFIDRVAESTNISWTIDHLYHLAVNRSCAFFGIDGWNLVINEYTELPTAVFQIMSIDLEDFHGITAKMCCTAKNDRYFDGKFYYDIEAFVRLYDSSSPFTRATIEDVHAGNLTGDSANHQGTRALLIGLNCTVVTENGLYPDVYWTGQSNKPQSQSSVVSNVLYLSRHSQNATEIFTCNYDIYGYTGYPTYQMKFLFGGNATSRTVSVDEIFEEKPGGIATEKTNKTTGFWTLTNMIILVSTITTLQILLVVVQVLFVGIWYHHHYHMKVNKSYDTNTTKAQSPEAVAWNQKDHHEDEDESPL